MAISRRDFLKAAGAAAAGTAAVPLLGAGEGVSRRPPNIVFFYADDVNLDWVGAYGGELLTPQVDRLAEEGMRFDRFYVTSAVCTPSRYSALTGRYASRSRTLRRRFPDGTQCNIRWNTRLTPGESTVAGPLRRAGYATGIVGKWHLGGPGRVKGVEPDADPRDPEVARKLRAAQQELCSHIRDNYGFDYASRIYHNNIEFIGLPEALVVQNLEWITEGGLEFIDRYHDRPFFLYFAPTLPHGHGHPDLKSDPHATPVGMLEEPPRVQAPRETILPRLKEAGVKNRYRGAAMLWIDDALAALMEKLRDYGLEENTLVIWVADHQARGKMTCYQGAHVPAVARWPAGIRPGLVCPEICANIDLAPTFWELAGAPSPGGEVVDGRSFAPLLSRPGRELREDLLLQVRQSAAAVTRNWKYIAVRDEKAIEQHEAGEFRPREKGPYHAHELFPAYGRYDQLYNLAEDPGEQHNLAGDPAYAKRLARMKDRLRRLLAALPHSFPGLKPG